MAGQRVVYLLALLVGLLVGGLASAQDLPLEAEGRLGSEVGSLVGQLLSDSRADREDARQKLLSLAGPSTPRAERVLELLPRPDEHMPPALADQLNELRVEIEKRIAKGAIESALTTLDVRDAPLSNVLEALELQTENKLLDYRKQFGEEVVDRLVTLSAHKAPFWQTMDRLLDQTEMDLYEYSGEEALALVSRGEGRVPRAQGACYTGPFRIAAHQVRATRSLTHAANDSLRVQLQIAWEPRLRPIVLSQPLADVVAVDERGQRFLIKEPDSSINLEPSAGNQAINMQIAFNVPDRSTNKIATLRGNMEVVAPGRKVEFRFEKLSQDNEPDTRRQGGVSVTLAGIRKNNAVWEVHMRLKLDQAGEALESHRLWVYENSTYLVDENEEQIDHAGFETTMQTEDTIGLAYIFDHEPGIEGLTWVYETPASVHRFPIEYELKDIPLP